METNNQKEKIYNLIIVDESGSMEHLLKSTLSGLNEVISSIRAAQQKYADTQEHFVSVLAFCDYERRYIYEDTPVADVRQITERDYHPCGCTPLYDATGMALTRLEVKSGDDVHSNQLVTIITDGLENSSKEYEAQSIKSLIERLTKKGWSFSYMGTGHDVKSVADLLSISNSFSFSNDNSGAKTMFEATGKAYSRAFDDINACCCCSEPMPESEILENKKRRAKNFLGH
ncbi:MAG: hypothetical protein MJ009_03245 [Paludibacteraceae bacterium]|nr:hypothetical protein [Paludibacteraceae bacterium]